ncbi:5-formyltetrahydrofolate cyclo-ligase [Marinilabiliaceae bacterium JC017]|nr:5-formyltetrahydrofolate cyclo-ligase [Marinilabiliaceae bacterium JC017]
MEDIKKLKKALRQQIRNQKSALNEEIKMKQTDAIFKQVETHNLFEQAQNILFYWSMDDEVNTQNFVKKWYQEKNIYLPVVKGDNLEICLFEGEESLKPGERYGIPEPDGTRLMNESLIELVFVPGMAFDQFGNRMGRGKGYYDRILNRIPQAKTIGLAYDFQMVKNVPVEPHDYKLDAVISPDHHIIK